MFKLRNIYEYFFPHQSKFLDMQKYVALTNDSQIWRLVRLNKIKTLKDILSLEKIDIDEPIVMGTKLNILHKSVILNKKEIFNLALIFKAKIDHRDENDITPLMRAVSLNRIYMVQKLLENGADPYLKDVYGKNCFDKANFYENEQVLDILEQYKK